MGNLFSGSRRRSEEARNQQILEAELRRRNTLLILQHQENQRQLEIRRSIISSTRRTDAYPSRIPSVFDSTTVSRPQRKTVCVLVNYITNHITTKSWAPMTSSETIKCVDLSSSSQEYTAILQMFKSTNKKCFKVNRIERIQNPYLYGAYLLKKEELSSRFGYTDEQLLFHGTKEHNMHKICEHNLDWRLHGKGTGHRFGRGVSFSPISNYATHYCDKQSNVKVMLVVKVLISRSCIGNGTMDLPVVGFDTSQKEDGHVIVKYYDNEYYPAYKLYFTQVDLYN